MRSETTIGCLPRRCSSLHQRRLRRVLIGADRADDHDIGVGGGVERFADFAVKALDSRFPARLCARWRARIASASRIFSPVEVSAGVMLVGRTVITAISAVLAGAQRQYARVAHFRDRGVGNRLRDGAGVRRSQSRRAAAVRAGVPAAPARSAPATPRFPRHHLG